MTTSRGHFKTSSIGQWLRTQSIDLNQCGICCKLWGISLFLKVHPSRPKPPMSSAIDVAGFIRTAFCRYRLLTKPATAHPATAQLATAHPATAQLASHETGYSTIGCSANFRHGYKNHYRVDDCADPESQGDYFGFDRCSSIFAIAKPQSRLDRD